jgi:hypothetical protein
MKDYSTNEVNKTFFVFCSQGYRSSKLNNKCHLFFERSIITAKRKFVMNDNFVRKSDGFVGKRERCHRRSIRIVDFFQQFAVVGLKLEILSEKNIKQKLSIKNKGPTSFYKFQKLRNQRNCIREDFLAA